MDRPLRVGVLVESGVVPEWVRWAVAAIDAMPQCELAAVVVAEGPPAGEPAPAVRRAAYRAYGWLDARVFGEPAGLRPAELGSLIQGRDGARELDVVVSFLAAGRRAWEGAPPRHGVWTFVPMDDGATPSAASRFWELAAGRGTAEVCVARVENGAVRPLMRAAVPTDALSLARTRDAAAWESARLLLRGLRRVHRDDGPEPQAEAVVGDAHLPPATVTAAHAARTAGRGAAARGGSLWRREEWFVAVRERSADGRVRGVLRELPNPAGRYLADPFAIEVCGRHFVFVEDFSVAAGRAVISVIEAGADGTWTSPRPVLVRDHHLSYPFVFEHAGEIWMLPETGQAGRIELHRAAAFPDRWVLHRVLLDGLVAVDPTLHMTGDGLWLFAQVVQGHRDPGELHLWSADALDGEWRSHPRNPVVTDPGTSRPAGRLFTRDGLLLRPGQDGSRRYGGAVVLNRVDELSATGYRETPIGRIEPDWAPGLTGTHTITSDGRYEWIDGYREVRRLRRQGAGSVIRALRSATVASRLDSE